MNGEENLLTEEGVTDIEHGGSNGGQYTAERMAEDSAAHCGGSEQTENYTVKSKERQLFSGGFLPTKQQNAKDRQKTQKT